MNDLAYQSLRRQLLRARVHLSRITAAIAERSWGEYHLKQLQLQLFGASNSIAFLERHVAAEERSLLDYEESH